MENFELIIFVSILIESLVEYAKSIYDFFEKKEYKKGITQLIVVLLSCLLTLAFNINLFKTLNIKVDPYLGFFISGILISRGSNYISDFLHIANKK